MSKEEAGRLEFAPLASSAFSGSSPHPRSSPAPRASLFSAARRPGRLLRIVALLCVPGTALALGIPVCPFAIMTHHPCPGCGLTRATLALLHGRVSEALRFHPLVIVVAPLVIGGGSFALYAYVTRGTWALGEALAGRWPTRASMLLMALLLAVWIGRFFGAFGGPVPVG